MKRAILALALAAASGLSIARAQEAPENSAAPIVLPAAPPATIQLPSNTLVAPADAVDVAPERVRAPKTVRKPVAVAPPKPAVPPGPPAPVRSPTAVLRVLDKVTAETLRFEAPVGRRVRYKTLIFMVRTCETRGVGDPLPRPSAYLVIESQPLAPPGEATPPSREIYRGWMFADSPDLHPFQHPVYDAWLESCTTDRPTS